MASNVTILGISGPSSSGKTTVARLLRSILKSTGMHAFILHEDDFYVTDADIPIHAETGLQDWDCLGSIDATAFEAALKHIKTYGESPEELQSKEDQNSVGKISVDDNVVRHLKEQARIRLPKDSVVAIIDGFLLYTPELRSLYSLMDIRLFLPLSRELMISRRAARSGYVTLEGFWEDPPGYVEQVVWPNYAKDHAFLFRNGDVKDQLDQEQLRKIQVDAAPLSATQDMTACLEWAWSVIMRKMQ